MQDRSKSVVLIACAVQAFIVAVTIAWVAATGSGASGPVAAQADDTSLSATQECDAPPDVAGAAKGDHDYGDDAAGVGVNDEDDQAQDCADDSAAGGGGGALDFGGISLY